MGPTDNFSLVTGSPQASAGERAKTDRRPLRSPACVACGDFLDMGNFAPISEDLHIKGRNFPDVFFRSRLPMTPMNHEIGPHFFRNPEHRHTQRQTRQL